jgi:hypothetical protein
MSANNQSKFKKTLVTVLQVMGIIFGLIIAVYVLDDHIKNEIKNITNDEAFLNRLIAEIHPYVIFDENNSIIVDKGGMSHIDRIEVQKEIDSKNPDIGKIPAKVIVYPNKHLETASLLKCIDTGDDYIIKSHRGEKYSWVYELDLSGFMYPRRINKFRLDIIR